MAIRIEDIQNAEVLGKFPTDALDRISEWADEIELDSGEDLSKDVGGGEWLYIIKTGMLGLYVSVGGDLLVPYAVLGTKRIVGMSGFPEERVFSITASTLIRVQAGPLRRYVMSEENMSLIVREELLRISRRRMAALVRALSGRDSAAWGAVIGPAPKDAARRPG
ncbi:MAG: hypothetical protein HY681_05590 [Chloroflexi bacterium]|nr:hypothetical protein [Chloroflexota bacterium]